MEFDDSDEATEDSVTVKTNPENAKEGDGDGDGDKRDDDLDEIDSNEQINSD